MRDRARSPSAPSRPRPPPPPPLLPPSKKKKKPVDAVARLHSTAARWKAAPATVWRGGRAGGSHIWSSTYTRSVASGPWAGTGPLRVSSAVAAVPDGHAVRPRTDVHAVVRQDAVLVAHDDGRAGERVQRDRLAHGDTQRHQARTCDAHRQLASSSRPAADRRQCDCQRIPSGVGVGRPHPTLPACGETARGSGTPSTATKNAVAIAAASHPAYAVTRSSSRSTGVTCWARTHATPCNVTHATPGPHAHAVSAFFYGGERDPVLAAGQCAFLGWDGRPLTPCPGHRNGAMPPGGGGAYIATEVKQLASEAPKQGSRARRNDEGGGAAVLHGRAKEEEVAALERMVARGRNRRRPHVSVARQRRHVVRAGAGPQHSRVGGHRRPAFQLDHVAHD